MTDLESWLERVYAAGGDREELDRAYDEWAERYDQDIWASGNPFIAIAAGLFSRHVRDYDARILDAGCGTGNMAQVLYQIGYDNIEGLDPSAGMLEVARRKEVYRALHQLTLGADVLQLTAITQDVGNAHEEIDAGYDGAEMTVAFNPEYLASGIDAIEGDEVTLATMDPMKPAVLRGVGHEDYLYLLMPVRVP